MALYEDTYPRSAETIVGALIKVFSKQKLYDIVNLLRIAKPRIEQTGYDGIDGGVYFYTLFLIISIDYFAENDKQLENYESIIVEKLKELLKNEGNQYLNSVTIEVAIEEEVEAGPTLTIDHKADHLWLEGHFRLFLCHVALHKVAVASVKRELMKYGVSAFVAHEDIEPTVIWQNEIRRALLSMQAMAALMTPDFHSSSWTDQEIGFALGRLVLIIPVRLGLDPYGFIGIQQGLTGDLKKPENLASDIVDLLLNNEQSKAQMVEALVGGLEKSSSSQASEALATKMAGIDYFTEGQLNRMEAACRDNFQVKQSFGVVSKLNGLIHRLRPLKAHDDDDDDLPF